MSQPYSSPNGPAKDKRRRPVVSLPGLIVAVIVVVGLFLVPRPAQDLTEKITRAQKRLIRDAIMSDGYFAEISYSFITRVDVHSVSFPPDKPDTAYVTGVYETKLSIPSDSGLHYRMVVHHNKDRDDFYVRCFFAEFDFYIHKLREHCW